jgi:CDP-diacylglycerol--glycerol-3-phosphate 3-phosphatidyltransferase
MKINLPNQITLARLALAVVFFVLLARYSHGVSDPRWLDVCGALFIVAALTDALDGYLARKQNQVTSFGRVLDPFVDKVLVVGAFVFFCGRGFVVAEGDSHRNVTDVQAWMVVLILGRELLVTGLRGFSEAQGDAFAANVFGKAKMLVQSTTVPVILFFLAHEQSALGRPSVVWIKTAFVWLTVIATTISLVAYLVKAKSILAETSRR